MRAAGSSVSSASKELTKLAQTYDIPVTATLMGLGCFPGDDPRWLGMLGMHGTYAANHGMSNADLILAVGARFDDRVTGKLSEFATKATMVHIDIDPTSIQKNVHVDVPIVADCRLFMEGLNKEMADLAGQKDVFVPKDKWLAQLTEWKTKHPVKYKPAAKGGFIKPQSVVEMLYKLTKGDCIISTEVGQNQMWAAQFFNYKKPRTLLTSGGLGTMGFGFSRGHRSPGGLSGQAGHRRGRGRLHPDVHPGAGHGRVLQSAGEDRHLNNGYLGMVRQWQELFYEKNYCSTCLDVAPDFVKLAEAYGAAGFRVTQAKELEATLKQAFSTPKPCIVDVIVDPEENVYPMVPAGKSITEMILV